MSILNILVLLVALCLNKEININIEQNVDLPTTVDLNYFCARGLRIADNLVIYTFLLFMSRLI
jgi:hypothetical protein